MTKRRSRETKKNLYHIIISRLSPFPVKSIRMVIGEVTVGVYDITHKSSWVTMIHSSDDVITTNWNLPVWLIRFPLLFPPLLWTLLWVWPKLINSAFGFLFIGSIIRLNTLSNVVKSLICIKNIPGDLVRRVGKVHAL